MDFFLAASLHSLKKNMERFPEKVQSLKLSGTMNQLKMPNKMEFQNYMEE